jgi:hypothetical protein
MVVHQMAYGVGMRPSLGHINPHAGLREPAPLLLFAFISFELDLSEYAEPEGVWQQASWVNAQIHRNTSA